MRKCSIVADHTDTGLTLLGSETMLFSVGVLAHGSEYVVVECCNDQQALKIIHRRINGQISGLNTSADKVQGRISVLGRFLARFRKAG